MKVRLTMLAAALLAGALALPAAAQDQPAAPQMSAEQKAMMQAWEKAATPGEAHKRLISQFEGTWTTKMTAWMDPSAPPMVEAGKSVHTSIFGGRQLRMDYDGSFMGQPYQGVGYIGHDNVKGKYISSWMDSMSTSMFVSEGDYNAASKTYTHRAQMDDPMKPGTQVATRTVLRMVDQDHAVFEMYETRGGKEAKSMQIEYTRAGK